MKLSRLSNRQLRRLLARGEVRFGDDGSSLVPTSLNLQKYMNKLEALENLHRRIAEKEASKLDPKYRKNMAYELGEIFKEAQNLRSSIRKVCDKIYYTVKQEK